MTDSSATSTRIHGLDTLRALAIVLVFLNHYQLFVSAAAFGPLGAVGWMGVDLFFGLSGYLIGDQILAALRGGRPFSLRHFYARRLLRTLPNFYCVLALYACWPAFRGDAAMLPLWKYLTFTQNINLSPGTAFSHAWSLCVEEQFYMLLPALALLITARRRSLRWAWGAIAAGIVAGMLARAYLWDEQVGHARGGLSYYKYIYYSTLCRFDELLAGVALALLKKHHARLWSRLSAHGNAALLAGAAGAALSAWLFHADRYGYAVTVFGYPLLAASVSLVIAAALSPATVLCAARVPGAAQLAAWSYAIYLTHKQLCILLKPQLLELGAAPDTAAAQLISAAASVGAGCLLYRLIETPFMRLRRRYLPGRGAAPALPA